MNALAKLSARIRSDPAKKTVVGPIGIDLALEYMHLVQLCRHPNDAIAVNAHRSVPYPVSRDEVFDSAPALTALIKSALRGGNFKGPNTVVALPGGAFRTMSVAYQVSPGQDENKILTSLMEDRIDGDLADYVIDYIPVRSRTKGTDRVALIAASPREPVIRFLDGIHRAGLEVDALEIGPLSIRRLIGSLPDMSPDDNVVVVNTGLATTFVTVLAGRRLLSDQDFRFGENALLQKLSESLDMTTVAAQKLVMRTGLAPLSRDDQVSVALNESGVFNTLLEIIKPEIMRLVTEIERAVLFTSSETHGGKVSRIYLVGALTRWRGIAGVLKNILGLEVANLSAPLSSFNNSSDSSPEMAVAAGLALRGLVDD